MLPHAGGQGARQCHRVCPGTEGQGEALKRARSFCLSRACWKQSASDFLASGRACSKFSSMRTCLSKFMESYYVCIGLIPEIMLSIFSAAAFPWVVPCVPSPACDPGKEKWFLASVYVSPNLGGKSKNNTAEKFPDYFPKSDRKNICIVGGLSRSSPHTKVRVSLLVKSGLGESAGAEGFACAFRSQL